MIHVKNPRAMDIWSKIEVSEYYPSQYAFNVHSFKEALPARTKPGWAFAMKFHYVRLTRQ